MSQIWLTEDDELADVPRHARALWIYHPKDRRPRAERVVRLGEFMEAPWKALAPVEILVIKNLVSRILTPSNRVKLGQFFTDPLEGFERYSVDRALFIVDPWRMWWHFGCVGVNFGTCHTSYLLETKWGLYLRGCMENPCSPEALNRWGTGVLHWCRGFKFAEIDLAVLPVSDEIQAAYQAEKAAAFAEEPTFGAIIKRLALKAQTLCPRRLMPLPRDLLSCPVAQIRATELGVDRFLLRGLQDRIALINHAAERFSVEPKEEPHERLRRGGAPDQVRLF
jgi:hypothetical protein